MPDWKKEVASRIAGLKLAPGREAEIVDEIAQHLADRYSESLAGGATDEEARRAAFEAIGGADLLAQGLERIERREPQEQPVLGSPDKKNVLAGVWLDVRFGLRTLGKNPGMTALVIITLAMGIGLNTAIFSIVNALLFRPLPVKHPEQIYTLSSDAGNEFSYPDLEDLRKQTSGLFSDMAGIEILGATGLSIAGKSERIWTDFVTGDFFKLPGIRPALGRFILPAEGRTAGADPVLVLNYSFWKVHLGGDPDIVGKRASINGRPVTIVGVAPEGFRPIGTLLETQAYMPLGMAVVDNQTKGDFLSDRSDKRLILIARLKPGVTQGQIKSILDVVAKRLAAQYPKADDLRVLKAFPLPATGPTSDPEDGLGLVGVLFLSLAGVVLILACVNVANVLLARASVRRGEIAIRAAVGANRGRLIWQLLTETVLLALLGGVGGIMVGLAASRVLSALPIHMDVPIVPDFHFDWRVFVYALAIALFAGVTAGIAPAWRATGGDLNAVLRGSGRTTTAGGHGFRKGLVVAQLAGSLMLLIVAGLFVRSLLHAENSDLGFDPRHVLNLAVDPSLAGYSEAQSYEFVDDLLGRVRALPGVQAASFAATVPMGGRNMGSSIAVAGVTAPPGQQTPPVGYNVVSAGYCEAMGMRILRGRGINEADGKNSARVAVINQAMAERFWPGEDPMGKRFSLEDEPEHPLQVVGVVKNSRMSDFVSPSGPYFYMALAQKPMLPLTLQVRSYGNPEAAAPEITGLIRSLAPGMPITGVQTMTDALDSPNGLWFFRLGAGLVAAMGIIGLILAIIGVYGVVAYMTAQRTHEIGMRLALGALPGDILRMVLRQGVFVIGLGSALGILIAFGVARLLAHLLVGVSSSDPLTYASVTLMLVLVALAACLVPALRATKVKPIVALRYE